MKKDIQGQKITEKQEVMVKSKKYYILLVLSLAAIIVAGFLLTACAKPSPTPTPTAKPSPTPKTLKLGVILPLSGPVAKWGIPFRNGAALLAKMINDGGGLHIGGDTYFIKLIEQDDKFTADTAATAARSLIERYKVDLIYGSIGSHVQVAIQEVSEPAGVICLHAAAADKTLKGKHYSFRGYLSYYETYPGLLRWVSKTYPEAKRIALLGLNYESSWYGHELVEKFAPRVGMSVVYNQYYEGGTKDFTPFLVKALATKPDIFFNTSSPSPDWALIMKQARELGYKGLFMESHPPAIGELVPIAGKDVVEGEIGVGYATSGPMASEATKNFVQAYVNKYGEWAVEALVLTPALDAIFQAMEQAGSLESDKVVAVLESGKTWETLVGIPGTFGLSKKYDLPHQWIAPQYVHTVKNGEDVAVAKISMDEIIHGWD